MSYEATIMVFPIQWSIIQLHYPVPGASYYLCKEPLPPFIAEYGDHRIFSTFFVDEKEGFGEEDQA